MTLTEWRLNKDQTTWANKVFGSENGQKLLKMLADSHVRHSQLPSTTDESPSMALGKIYGYDLCVNNVEAACFLDLPPAPLVETFGARPPHKI